MQQPIMEPTPPTSPTTVKQQIARMPRKGQDWSFVHPGTPLYRVFDQLYADLISVIRVYKNDDPVGDLLCFQVTVLGKERNAPVFKQLMMPRKDYLRWTYTNPESQDPTAPVMA